LNGYAEIQKQTPPSRTSTQWKNWKSVWKEFKVALSD